jgi:4-hydroxy-tetrahydrodipicolinate synthase
MNLGRILVPVVTPFKENGEVNYDKFSELLSKTEKENYCDSIIIMATTGEFASLSFEERVNVIKCAREPIKEKPLIAATSAVSTWESLNLTKEAEKAGADVALMLPPYYYRPGQEELFEHFNTIASQTNIPIMIYNLVITGVNVSAATIVRLAKIDNFIGVKEIGSNFFQTTEMKFALKKAGLENKFKIYAGSAKLSLPLLSQGAVGVVTEGIVGNATRQIVENFFAGEVEKANDIYLDTIIPYFNIYSKAGVVPGMKYALNLLGFDVGKPRLPLKELNDDQKEFIENGLKQSGLL